MRLALALCLSIAAGCRGAELGDDRYSMRGPHAVLVDERAGPDGQLTVFRPATLSTDPPHPAVVWSVGTGGPPAAHAPLPQHLAPHR
ncbi:MAG TPA: hypothetical protein PKE25_01615, partial [Novosphingobium sp.]|nr:hypothetical protein [Novosphingobium sp.]